MTRPISGTYDDPVDLVWRALARELGMRIATSDEVFASWDGADTLTLCGREDYDPDDSLAQLILHEVCHALVQGPAMRRRVDWGLANDDPEASALEEHACHRLQAALLDRHGLRSLLGVTTDWRPYWDALPDDPLAPDGDPATLLARSAWPEAVRGPWSEAIDAALTRTATIAAAMHAVAPDESLWSRVTPLHPEVPAAQSPALGSCGSCGWRQDGRCRVHDATPVGAHSPACTHWEAPLDAESCATCGACCREGFHVVGVEPDEPMARHAKELLARDEGLLVVPRPHGRCVALESPEGPPWRCAHYAHRPTSCRDFEIQGDACLEARRRVGSSRLA